MTEKEKLKHYLEYKAITKNAFYTKTGFSVGFLDSGRSLGADKIRTIIDNYPDLSLQWLILDHGEMISKDNYHNADDKDRLPKTAKRNSKGFPLIPVEAFAGLGGGSISINEHDIQERYVVPDFTNVDFMIRIKGNSMYPKYSSGDVVACTLIRNSSFLQWGKVHVLHTKEQGALVKRLFPVDNDTMIECRSDNESYPPFNVSKEEITNIALVVGVIRLE